jgi:hypothetical protein
LVSGFRFEIYFQGFSQCVSGFSIIDINADGDVSNQSKTAAGL